MTTTTNNEHKKLNVPNLRFPEFQGEWEKNKLCDVSTIVGRIGFRGYTTQDIVDEGKGAIALSPTNIVNNKLTYEKDNTYISFHKFEESPEIMINQGDVIFVKTGSTVGKVAYVGELICKTTLNPQVVVLKNILCDNYLLSVIMSTQKFQNKIRKITVGGAVPTLSQVAMGKIFISLPKVEEQAKLSKFIALFDERIATQNKIIEDLKKLKCAIIETEYNGKGHECRIGDIIEQTSLRNKNNLVKTVLSVNNKLGFINQEEQFEDRAVASEDTSNYKVVTKDDFAYNPARINVGSIARLKSFNKGIVSPMYICFKVTDGIVPEYLESYFTTNRFFKEMQKRLEGSVRLCLSFEGLCNIPISIPCMDEQVEIGKRICQIENMIETEYNILSLYEKQKLYLLRQMLI